jgi:hypothetical protein
MSSAGTCVPSDGGCYYAPFDAGTPCNDNNGCTSGEKCNGAGSCGSGFQKVCNTPGAGQPCLVSVGSCMPADGGCVYPPVDAGTACNDGNACSFADQCNGTACSGTPYTCTPNECQQQVPACAGDGGCAFTADNSKNGTACALDASQLGTCVSGTCSSFPYVPSNFDPDEVTPTSQLANLPSVNLTCDATFDSSTLVWTMGSGCTSAPAVSVRLRSQSGGPQVVILPMKQLDIAAGKTLKLVGDKPVILAVYGNATLNGKILANGVKQLPGAGGNSTLCGTRVGSDGAVKGSDITGSGGGGGGHAFLGGDGGRGASLPDATASKGGAAVSSTTLVPLVGGCAGGRGGQLGTTASGLGGAGGGAVQLSVAGTLLVKDIVSVSAGGGAGGDAVTADAAGGGGGGSGGGLLLEANGLDLAASSILTANGGGGGEGGQSGVTPVKGKDGADGAIASNVAAPGGTTVGGGGGGNGGIGATANNAGPGGNGTGNEAGGGGGGAVGRIRVYGRANCNMSSTVISPAPTKGGLCL